MWSNAFSRTIQHEKGTCTVFCVKSVGRIEGVVAGPYFKVVCSTIQAGIAVESMERIRLKIQPQGIQLQIHFWQLKGPLFAVSYLLVFDLLL